MTGQTSYFHVLTRTHMHTGGHFAASVFKARASDGRQQGKQGAGSKGGADEAFEVLAHKTFHRYVIR